MQAEALAGERLVGEPHRLPGGDEADGARRHQQLGLQHRARGHDGELRDGGVGAHADARLQRGDATADRGAQLVGVPSGGLGEPGLQIRDLGVQLRQPGGERAGRLVERVALLRHGVLPLGDLPGERRLVLPLGEEIVLPALELHHRDVALGDDIAHRVHLLLGHRGAGALGGELRLQRHHLPPHAVDLVAHARLFGE